MKKNNVDELICRLMSGETTPEEERQLQQLLHSQSSLSSEEKAVLQFLDAAFHGRPQDVREADAESILPPENANEIRICAASAMPFGYQLCCHPMACAKAGEAFCGSGESDGNDGADGES